MIEGPNAVTVRVDLYKPSGKWYTGGDVILDIGKTIWTQEFRAHLREEQGLVKEECFWDYHVVVSHKPESEHDSRHYFLQHLFLARSAT